MQSDELVQLREATAFVGPGRCKDHRFTRPWPCMASCRKRVHQAAWDVRGQALEEAKKLSAADKESLQQREQQERMNQTVAKGHHVSLAGPCLTIQHLVFDVDFVRRSLG